MWRTGGDPGQEDKYDGIEDFGFAVIAFVYVLLDFYSFSFAFRHSVSGSLTKGSTLGSFRKVSVMISWQKYLMESR